MAFLEADDNGDGWLEWREFRGAVERLRVLDGTMVADAPLQDEDQLRALFDSIDSDKSGTIESNSAGPRTWSTTVHALTVDQRSRPCCESDRVLPVDPRRGDDAGLRPRGDLQAIRQQR